uniref:Uncharacterized protein n=1 Tax=Anguilla anguilla TaxID=7936 RepID=A0A0E9X904_ANGAN
MLIIRCKNIQIFLNYLQLCNSVRFGIYGEATECSWTLSLLCLIPCTRCFYICKSEYSQQTQGGTTN